MELAQSPGSLGEQLSALHERIREEFPGVERVGVALYDPKSDLLRLFVHGAGSPDPLPRQNVHLSDVPSLLALAQSREAQVVNDLSLTGGSSPVRPGQVPGAGVRSSFTQPFFSGGRLRGFLFLDSGSPGYFDAAVVDRLKAFAQFLSLVFLNGLEPARLLRSAVRLAATLVSLRDEETGTHLERVSQYAGFIARALPPAYGVDGEFVEFLGFFAPAHDIGKVAIPDHILGKRSRFTPEEVELMKTHVGAGVTFVENLIRELDLDGLLHVSMLRSIVRCHHEAVDGSGYPDGLTAAQIPLEARIVSVADVFDALTASRSYKEPWSDRDAFRYLEDGKGKQFDPACVAAFLSRSAEASSFCRRSP